MVTKVVQPPQPVANCFQLLKLLGGTIKRPHMYGLRERENYYYYTLLVPYPSLIPRASCTFPVHFRKPLFPWDTHPFICYLVCTSLEGVLARQGLDGSGRRSAKALEGSGDLSTYFCTYYFYNTEVSCCSWRKRVSVCFNVWRIFIIQAFIMIYLMFYMNLTNI